MKSELSLFTGIGGGLLGTLSEGYYPVCGVEIDNFAREVLFARQKQHLLPHFPIWDDIKTFDPTPWKGVHLVSGGFPCQDISHASSTERKGLRGDKSSLWFEMVRVIQSVKPKEVLIENSPNLIRKGLATILQNLTEMGYDAIWGNMGACDTGAPHKRNRLWVFAYTNDKGQRSKPFHVEMEGSQKPKKILQQAQCTSWLNFDIYKGMDVRSASRVDLNRASGNAQVPAVVRAFLRLKSSEIGK